MQNSIHKLLVITIFLGVCFPLIAQKKTPNDINGYKNYKFFTTITDYPNSNARLLSSRDKFKDYEITPSFYDSKFLDTRISKIIIREYKNKIYSITLLINDNISSLLENIFTDYTYTTNSSLDEWTRRLVEDKPYNYMNRKIGGYGTNNSNPYNSDLLREHEITNELKTRNLYQITDTTWQNQLSFVGTSNDIIFGVMTVKSHRLVNKVISNMTFTELSSIELSKSFFLTFQVYNFKNEINANFTKSHRESFLKDFGIDNEQKNSSQKQEYTIPLFELNNTFYVRVYFGDVLEQTILDTGANEVIISKNLFNELNSKGKITRLNEYKEFIIASGEKTLLEKVIISNLNINELEAQNVVAFVNSDDTISLLGQSFLKRFGEISINHKDNIMKVIK